MCVCVCGCALAKSTDRHSSQDNQGRGSDNQIDAEFDSNWTMSVFAGCTEACGWTAAVVSTLAFGSFGVPIKAASSVEVDPLVMQVRANAAETFFLYKSL